MSIVDAHRRTLLCEQRSKEVSFSHAHAVPKWPDFTAVGRLRRKFINISHFLIWELTKFAASALAQRNIELPCVS